MQNFFIGIMIWTTFFVVISQWVYQTKIMNEIKNTQSEIINTKTEIVKAHDYMRHATCKIVPARWLFENKTVCWLTEDETTRLREDVKKEIEKRTWKSLKKHYEEIIDSQTFTYYR